MLDLSIKHAVICVRKKNAASHFFVQTFADILGARDIVL